MVSRWTIVIKLGQGPLALPHHNGAHDNHSWVMDLKLLRRLFPNF